MKIKHIKLGLPEKTGTQINIRVMSFETNAKTCGLYYEIVSDENEKLAEGNYQLTEEEFSGWGFDNSYLEYLVLTYLGLEKI